MNDTQLKKLERLLQDIDCIVSRNLPLLRGGDKGHRHLVNSIGEARTIVYDEIHECGDVEITSGELLENLVWMLDHEHSEGRIVHVPYRFFLNDRYVSSEEVRDYLLRCRAVIIETVVTAVAKENVVDVTIRAHPKAS